MTIAIDQVSFRYGSRTALEQVTFDVPHRAIFALLGPNGSGKTTLFQLVATLLPMQQGVITVGGCDVAADSHTVRQRLGVVFQTPSLDGKLTVAENMTCQATLCGLRGPERSARIAEMLEQVGLADRRGDIVDTLSGGLKRRLDLARGILSRPDVLLLDEPTQALDPAARHDVWHYLRQLRETTGTTILFTTHLLEEADRCDQIAILDQGRLVACASPAELKAQVKGDIVSIRCRGDHDPLQRALREQFDCQPHFVDNELRIECPQGHVLVPRIVELYPDTIDAITVSKPTLADVFVRTTGHQFWSS